MLTSSIFPAAFAAQRQLDEAGIRSCIIGGIALQRWGETRLTTGVDFTLAALIGTEQEVVTTLANLFRPRFPDADRQALAHRVYLALGEQGVALDFSLGSLDFELRAIDRATRFDFGSGLVRTCSAEDLVVYKAFAGRDKDWVDLNGVILRQGPKLNWPQILEELKPLADLKEAPELVNKLIALRDRLA